MPAGAVYVGLAEGILTAWKLATQCFEHTTSVVTNLVFFTAFAEFVVGVTDQKLAIDLDIVFAHRIALWILGYVLVVGRLLTTLVDTGKVTAVTVLGTVAAFFLFVANFAGSCVA